MSPASYQTAPPRVVWIADLGLWIADWSKSQRRSPSRWPLTQSAFRNPQSALARAGNGTRTRDPNLGKVVLYQLSYSRASYKLALCYRVVESRSERRAPPKRRRP